MFLNSLGNIFAFPREANFVSAKMFPLGKQGNIWGNIARITNVSTMFLSFPRALEGCALYF